MTDYILQIVTSSMKHTDKGILYKFLQPWLNDGLLLSKGYFHSSYYLRQSAAFDLNKFLAVFTQGILAKNTQR